MFVRKPFHGSKPNSDDENFVGANTFHADSHKVYFDAGKILTENQQTRR